MQEIQELIQKPPSLYLLPAGISHTPGLGKYLVTGHTLTNSRISATGMHN